MKTALRLVVITCWVDVLVTLVSINPPLVHACATRYLNGCRALAGFFGAEALRIEHQYQGVTHEQDTRS